MSFTDTEDGERIFYRVAGDEGAERTVVLIQGLALSHRFWFTIPDDLASDPQRPRRVIALDNRGTGQSSRAKPPYSMKRLAADIACVMRAAKVDKATLVGISMGGMIAQHVALKHPELVRGLVLMATTPGLPHGRLPSPKTIATLLTIGAGRDRGGKLTASLLLPPSEMHRAREHFAGWLEEMRASPPSPASFAGQMAAIAGHSTGFSLGKIRVPTVVVTGDADVLVPPKNSHVLAKAIANARLEILPGVGHGIPMLDKLVVRRALESIDS